MNLMVQPNRLCLIVKLYINRPELLPDTHDICVFSKKTTIMKILRTLICAALLVAGLNGCEKIDVNKLEGTWFEQYDPTVFAMDGSVTYTFDGNNGYQLHVYDAL